MSFAVLRGGKLGNLGQTANVTTTDVIKELDSRGYEVQVHAPVHHVPTPTAPTLTKSMAINVSIDEAIIKLNIPRTGSHYFRCPTGSCPINSATWNTMVGWCVQVANGYLSRTYSLPTWAQSMLHSGTLSGYGLGSTGRLAGFQDWLQQNTWFVNTVGDAISNYGEFLTAKNVQDAIKANTDQQLTKEDAMKLVAAWQAQGKIPAGKTGVVADGAVKAAQSPWMMPALIGGGVLLVVLLMKK